MKNETITEIWKDIPNYDGYQASNIGRIRTFVFHGKNTRIKKQSICNGYLSVNIGNKRLKSHRLIASAFINNPFNKEQINHINGIKTDNRIENLEWVTRKENLKHSFKCLGRKSNGSKKSNVLNLQTGIYYNSISEAFRAINQPLFKFYSKGIKHIVKV